MFDSFCCFQLISENLLHYLFGFCSVKFLTLLWFDLMIIRLLFLFLFLHLLSFKNIVEIADLNLINIIKFFDKLKNLKIKFMSLNKNFRTLRTSSLLKKYPTQHKRKLRGNHNIFRRYKTKAKIVKKAK